jgi:type II secretory pathway component PulF
MNLADMSLSNSERIGLVSNLATMLSAGIPILEAVNSILEDSRGNTKKILEELHADLSQGKHMYVTFLKFPRVFDKVTVSVVKASEEAGTLDVTLKDLRESIRKEIEFSDKVKSALLYPMFIIFVFLIVFMLILLVVVPKISTIFLQLRVTLPLPTRIMIFLSNALVNNAPVVILGGAGLVLLLMYVYRRNRAAFAQLLYALPLISQIIREIDLTRFSRSMYLLLYSGIPITSALELAQEVIAKKETARIIAGSREMLLSGKPLSSGLRNSKGYIPTIMIKLIEAGEKTGSLDKSMLDISEYFDYQVSQTLKTFTALLEPVMLVLVGFVIGGMMVAIISPIYGLISQVGQR